MSLKFTRVFGDDSGETHFADMELQTESVPGSGPVSALTVPVERMTYAEYPPEPSEMMPGFHTAPARQFLLLLGSGFEVTTSDGESRRFEEGEWIFFDDLSSKGHRTKGLGTERRVNLVIPVADDWSPPGA